MAGSERRQVVEASAPGAPGTGGDAPTAGSSFAAAAFGTFSATIGVGILSLANVIVTSRSLGPSGRGELAFVTTMAMLTATLSTFGIEEANANIAGREPHHRRSLATNSVLLALAFGGGAAMIVVVSILVFPAMGGDAGLGLCALALLFVPLLVLQFYLQLLIQADYGFLATNTSLLLGPLVNIVVNGAFAVAGILTVETALVTWLAGQTLSTLLMVRYVHRRLAGFGRPDGSLARRSLGFGAKAHLGRAMKTGNYRLDVWLVGALAGSREVGLYSVAVSWSEALFYLPTALSTALRPDIVRASEADAARRTTAVFRTTMLVTLPLVVLFVVGAPFLCVTIFGDAFAGSVKQLRILAPGAFGVVALKLFANALTAQRKPMFANAALGVGFLLTIGLDLALIPRLGGVGAAIASTVAYTAGGVTIALIFVRSLRSSLLGLLPRPDDITRFVPRHATWWRHRFARERGGI